MVKLTTTICQYIISEFKPSLSYTRHTVSTNKIKLEASFHREKARQNRYIMSTLLAVGVSGFQLLMHLLFYRVTVSTVTMWALRSEFPQVLL